MPGVTGLGQKESSEGMTSKLYNLRLAQTWLMCPPCECVRWGPMGGGALLWNKLVSENPDDVTNRGAVPAPCEARSSLWHLLSTLESARQRAGFEGKVSLLKG